MKKYVIFGLISVTLFLIIFILIFAKDKKNAATVKENITQIKSGMSILEVRKLLNNPDTVYNYDSTARYGSGVTVMKYFKGLGTSDVVHVLIRKDTVVEVIQND